jgi:hypothetical protein
VVAALKVLGVVGVVGVLGVLMLAAGRVEVDVVETGLEVVDRRLARARGLVLFL